MKTAIFFIFTIITFDFLHAGLNPLVCSSLFEDKIESKTTTQEQLPQTKEEFQEQYSTEIREAGLDLEKVPLAKYLIVENNQSEIFPVLMVGTNAYFFLKDQNYSFAEGEKQGVLSRPKSIGFLKNENSIKSLEFQILNDDTNESILKVYDSLAIIGTRSQMGSKAVSQFLKENTENTKIVNYEFIKEYQKEIQALINRGIKIDGVFHPLQLKFFIDNSVRIVTESNTGSELFIITSIQPRAEVYFTKGELPPGYTKNWGVLSGKKMGFQTYKDLEFEAAEDNLTIKVSPQGNSQISFKHPQAVNSQLLESFRERIEQNLPAAFTESIMTLVEKKLNENSLQATEINKITIQPANYNDSSDNPYLLFYLNDNNAYLIDEDSHTPLTELNKGDIVTTVTQQAGSSLTTQFTVKGQIGFKRGNTLQRHDLFSTHQKENITKEQIPVTETKQSFLKRFLSFFKKTKNP